MSKFAVSMPEAPMVTTGRGTKSGSVQWAISEDLVKTGMGGNWPVVASKWQDLQIFCQNSPMMPSWKVLTIALARQHEWSVDIAFAHSALVSFIYRIGKPLACQWHIDSDVLVHSITLKDYLEFE
ncbi:hypothetical protein [Pectobacterium zantedeschiae]|nr:hypothetical protein [Pectobacterium zantedeschiae]